MTDIDTPTIVPADASGAIPGMAPTEPPFSDFVEAAMAGDTPTQIPPGEESAASDDSGVTAATWHSNKAISRLYQSGPNNAWIAIAGVGWRRLHAATESGLGAMALIASHAVDNGNTVYAYEATDGQIHTIYHW